MSFIKQVVVIGNSTFNPGTVEVVTNRADNINVDFDMDELGATVSFTLPYIDSRNETFHQNSDLLYFKNNIKKWTPIRIFAKLMDTNEDNAVDLYNNGELPQCFIGVVSTINLKREKTSYSYDINCIGRLVYVANEMKMIAGTNYSDFQGSEFFDYVIENCGCAHMFDLTKVYRNISNNDSAAVKWSNSVNVKDILTQVNENYGIKIHEQGDGYINIFDPLYYFEKDVDGDLPGVQVNAWEFTLGDNMFNIDYGDLTTDVNMVECWGLNDVGYAIDFTNIVLKAGELGFDDTEAGLYNREIIVRPQLTDLSECELEAKNHLLERSRNNVISFPAPFDSDIKVGDFVTVTDGELYDGQLMMVKHINYSISKTDVCMNLTVYKSVLATQPTNLIVSKVGITDLDILEVRKDSTDPVDWNSFEA